MVNEVVNEVVNGVVDEVVNEVFVIRYCEKVYCLYE